tara:strand:+ start:321 stop:974 length:654 start_codon:yes stop_codon:yes gene_type:complete
MNFETILSQIGEHKAILDGPAGAIEAVISIPNDTRGHLFAVLGHPHSLHGGTMTNKVVTTLARTFSALNIPSIRFNFRGVGQTQGQFDHGVGESEDMLFLVEQIKKTRPQTDFIFAGFSFGSYVTYRAASQHPHKLLISIAPPVERFDYNAFKSKPAPWLIVQGLEDEVVVPQFVLDFAKAYTPLPDLITFEKTGHFFHGQLVALKDQLTDYITKKV